MNKILRKHNLIFLLMVLALSLVMSACGSDGEKAEAGAPEIEGLTYADQLQLDYAESFSVYNYEDGYSVIDVKDDSSYLIVPDGSKVPENLPEGMVVISKNPENIYMGATSVMALYDSMGAMDQIRLTELKASGWTVDSAKAAMEDGKILYAGKFSNPDYELILSEGCQLAIESTMIYHNPEVKEMLEKLGIPVFVDRSSYESDPLGRAEWIKAYGVISDSLDEATEFFNQQKEIVSNIEKEEKTGKTVVFFYVTTSGKVVVRSSSDYVPAMIERAGGEYCFDGLADDSGKASVSMTLESFYEGACQADYIVYNGSIDGTVKTISDLEAKNEIFSKFKAVQSGNCYCSDSLMYQRTDMIGNMVMDFHRMLSGQEEDQMVFLKKMEK